MRKDGNGSLHRDGLCVRRGFEQEHREQLASVPRVADEHRPLDVASRLDRGNRIRRHDVALGNRTMTVDKFSLHCEPNGD